jgi:hypothetical protein
LLAGIDTTSIGYYGNVRKDLYDRINSGGNRVVLDGLVFAVRREKRGPYRLTLDNKLMHISVDNSIRYASSPPVYVQMKSFFIWSRGFAVAYQELLQLMDWVFDGKIETEKVSRVDLFADLDWKTGFKETDVRKFITRAKKKDVHLEHKNVCGFSIGRGTTKARIYDKTREADYGGKEWLSELWGRDNLQVWRVEFQFRREPIKDSGIETVIDLLNESQNLWDYGATEWLSMREMGNKNVSRRRLTPFWKRVAAVKLWEPRFASMGLNG